MQVLNLHQPKLKAKSKRPKSKRDKTLFETKSADVRLKENTPVVNKTKAKEQIQLRRDSNYSQFSPKSITEEQKKVLRAKQENSKMRRKELD